MINKRIILLVFLFCIPKEKIELQSQVPVGLVVDVPLNTQNVITLATENLMKFLLKKEGGFVGLIKEINQFFLKSETIVNSSIKNMRMIRSIIDTNKDILELYKKTLDALNSPIVAANDFETVETEIIDKWKHIQILLGLIQQSEAVLDLLAKLIEDDALTMDDKGRIQLIHQSYKDMLKIKSGMRIAVRRINKEIYQYYRQKRAIASYKKLFRFD